jgi:hypothetical protein
MPLRRFARSWEGNTGRRRNVSPPLIPRFHGTRSPTLVRDETRRATGPRRGGDSSLDGGKKREREGGREGGREEGRAGLYFPLTSERKETIAAHEVEYKLSSGDRARNQSTSCPVSALSLPPPRPSSLPSSSLFRTSPDVTRRGRMRSLCNGAKKLGQI